MHPSLRSPFLEEHLARMPDIHAEKGGDLFSKDLGPRALTAMMFQWCKEVGWSLLPCTLFLPPGIVPRLGGVEELGNESEQKWMFLKINQMVES